MRTLAAAAVAATLVFGAGQASANLLTNGDFSASGTGWTVNSNAFFFDASGYREGNVGDVGSISQTFSSTPGATLTVTFDYGGNSGYQYVDFNGSTVAGSFIGNPSAFMSYSFTLGTATGSDTLTFFGRNDPSFNTLANVVVSEVPEPASLAVLGLGVLGLAASRRRSA